jgi:hypothetical protein
MVVLATVTVDGVMETPLWTAAVERLIGNPGRGVDPKTYMLLQSVLLLAGPLLLGAVYLVVVAVMARIAGQPVAPVAG